MTDILPSNQKTKSETKTNLETKLETNQKIETEETIKISFTNTKQDFWQLYLHSSFSVKMITSKFFLFVLIFVVLIIFQSISSNFKMNYQFWLPIYFFGIPIFWEYLLFIAAKINITNTTIFPKIFTFSKELIETDLGYDERKYKWSSLVQTEQNKNYYFFIFFNKLGKSESFIIPKKDLEKEQISKLDSLLKAKNKL